MRTTISFFEYVIAKKPICNRREVNVSNKTKVIRLKCVCTKLIKSVNYVLVASGILCAVNLLALNPLPCKAFLEVHEGDGTGKT